MMRSRLATLGIAVPTRPRSCARRSNRRAAAHRATSVHARLLRVEPLEDRRLLSVETLGLGVVLSTDWAGSDPDAATALIARSESSERVNRVALQDAETVTRTVTIGTGSATWYFPLATYYETARMQTIYRADEIGGSGSVLSLALDISQVPCETMTDFTIRMKHTSLESFTPGTAWETEWTTVYHADETISSTGWYTFDLSSPFEYDGTSNLLVDFSFTSAYYSGFNGFVRSSTPAGNRSMVAAGAYLPDPLSWSGTTPSPIPIDEVPNVQLVINTTFPTASSFVPSDNANGVVVDTNLAIHFSKQMRKGAGDIVLKKWDDNSVVETIPVDSGQVTVSGNVATIDPAFDLFPATAYYVLVASGAFEDVGGNDYSGISDRTTWDFTTAGIPPATPVVTSQPVCTPESSYTLSWESVDGADGYYLEYSTAPDFEPLEGNSGWITETHYTFSDLTPGTSYYYRVKAGVSVSGTHDSWIQTSQSDFEHIGNSAIGVNTAISPGNVLLQLAEVPGRIANPGFEDSSSWSIYESDWHYDTDVSADSNFWHTEGSHGARIAANGIVSSFSDKGYAEISQSVDLTDVRGITFDMQLARTSGSSDGAFIAKLCIDNEVEWIVVQSGEYLDQWIDVSEYSGVHTLTLQMEEVASEICPAEMSAQWDDFHTWDFVSSGTFVSAPITPSLLDRWGSLNFSKATPAGTLLTVDVLDAANNLLAVDVSSGTDLSSLGITAPSIKLRANLSTSDVLASPSLGDWTLMWQATPDTYAESAWSETVSSTHDDSPPSSSVTAPTTMQTAAPFTVSWTHSDDTSGVDLIRLYYSYEDGTYEEFGDGYAGMSTTFTAPDGDGTYAFYTRATDNAGNVEAPPVTADCTVEVDTSAPISSVGALDAYYTTNILSIPYTASDGNGTGVSGVKLWYRRRSLDGDTWGNWTQCSGTFNSSPITFNAGARGGNGHYEFYTVATDNAGHTESAPVVADAATDVVALTAPVLNQEPAFTSGTSNTIQWSAVGDADEYYVECYDESDLNAPVDASGWITATQYTFSGLTDGISYHYRARARASATGAVGAWSQTTQTDFRADTLTNVSLTSSSDDLVVLADDMNAEIAGRLLNAGFESFDANNIPTSWTAYNAYNTYGGQLIDKGVHWKSQGDYSVEIWTYGEVKPGGYSRGVYQSMDLTGVNTIQFDAYTDRDTWSNVKARVWVDNTMKWEGVGDGALHLNQAVDVSGYSGTHTLKLGLYFSGGATDSEVVWFDNVRLLGIAHVSSGTVVSTPITPSPLHEWGTLTFAKNVPTNTSLTVDILDLSNSVLASNVASGNEPEFAGHYGTLHQAAREPEYQR